MTLPAWIFVELSPAFCVSSVILRVGAEVDVSAGLNIDGAMAGLLDLGAMGMPPRKKPSNQRDGDCDQQRNHDGGFGTVQMEQILAGAAAVIVGVEGIK